LFFGGGRGGGSSGGISLAFDVSDLEQGLGYRYNLQHQIGHVVRGDVAECFRADGIAFNEKCTILDFGLDR
jgi:hypothetical protein